MANKLNQPLCATVYGNSGFGACVLEPGKFKGAIQVPSNFEIAESDLDDLQEFLVSKTHEAVGSRIFLYHNFIGNTDNTEDSVVNTTDYGSKIFIRDGFYDWTMRYLKGGVMLHNEIAKNAGSGKYFLFYDDKGVLFGYKSGGKLKGIPTEMFLVPPWRPATGADAAIYNLRFVIDPVYMNQGNLGYFKVEGFNIFDVVGLEDAELKLDEIASNVATVKAVTRISGVDLHDAYASNLAAVSAWEAENEAGEEVTITTVTSNVAAKGWDITFDNTDFTAADKVYLTLTAPATLKESPISVTGIDSSIALEIEAPSS